MRKNLKPKIDKYLFVETKSGLILWLNIKKVKYPRYTIISNLMKF